MTTGRPTTAPLLLEIGSEEIPARFIPGAVDELARRFSDLVAEVHLEATGVRVLATPRRLVLMAEAMTVVQPDREVVVKGPPVAVAFGDDGTPTPAGKGFAKKAGVDLADCEQVTGSRGVHLQARRTEPGRSAAEVLAENLPALVLGLPFRKVMRWGDLDLEYPRPLQWLLALLGDEIIPLKVGPYVAGRISRGHRTLSGDRTVEIAEPGDYIQAMRQAGVVVDHHERRQLISDGLVEALAAFDPNAELLEDTGLLDEVVHLCEYPTPFVGSFDKRFLELPDRVVTTALKAHQRYFSVGSRDGGGLLPCFAAVRDGGTDHLGAVTSGNERVLRARLADALFYWNFDQKKTPDERASQLASVTWLEGFGSVLDKTRRLAGLTADLWRGGMGDGQEPPAALARAAALCKSDLVSEMIRDGKEFTKLEGFIGARYAELAGEAPEVCRAIEHHYDPRSASAQLPADRISAVLGVGDRLDNLAGCWRAGFAPTGAKDPYALRRHTLSVLRVLLDLQARVDLQQLLDKALAPFTELGTGDAADSRREMAAFVVTRMERYFVEVAGHDLAVVRAVLPVRWSDPVDAKAWIAALSGYRDRADFQQLATGFKRCRNILEGKTLPMDALDACRERWLAGGRLGAGGEDISNLPEVAEQQLQQKVAAAADKLSRAEDTGEYEMVFDILSSFGPDIDAFFEQVRVNIDDRELRARRRAFLREIHGLFARYAEFTAVAATD